MANEGSESIGRITTRGALTNVWHPTIHGPWGITARPDGALWFANWDAGDRRKHGARGGQGTSIGRITVGGVVTEVQHAGIRGPFGVAAGPDGALWFTSYRGNSIGRVTPRGDIQIFRHPSLRGPQEIAAGPDGALWFANVTGDSIGRITVGGAVTRPGHPSPVGHRRRA